MTTEIQIAANGRDSKKGTGAGRPGGKSHSRLNAVSTGIYARSELLPGEDPKALAALRLELSNNRMPVDPIETELVELLGDLLWRSRRLRRAQHAALMRTETMLSLSHRAKQAGQAPTAVDDVERAVFNALAQDVPATALGAARESLSEVGPPTASGTPSNAREVTLVPPDYTFLINYGASEFGQLSAEIERRIREVTREIVRLEKALFELQARRMTYAVEAVEEQ